MGREKSHPFPIPFREAACFLKTKPFKTAVHLSTRARSQERSLNATRTFPQNQHDIRRCGSGSSSFYGRSIKRDGRKNDGKQNPNTQIRASGARGDSFRTGGGDASSWTRWHGGKESCRGAASTLCA